MMEEKVSNTYALSLLELGVADNNVDALLEELTALVDSISKDATIWSFFKAPVVSVQEKMKVIDKHFKASLSKTMYNFMGVLVKRRRVDELPGILSSFIDLLDEKMGRKRVTIESAVDLSSEQIEELRQSLAQAAGKNLSIKVNKNPALLGGLVVRYGDQKIDTSLSNQLDLIQKRLLEQKILGEKYYEN